MLETKWKQLYDAGSGGVLGTSSRNHRQEIKLGKVDQMWFLDLVLLRGREVPEANTSRIETSDEDLSRRSHTLPSRIPVQIPQDGGSDR